MTTDHNQGRLLAKRYRLIELVGKGAMGQVYRAEDTLLGGVTVAVKFISQSLLTEKRRDRFEQEAKICALLGERSIHIVQVRDYGVDENNVPFYAMEFLQGESLSQVIKAHPLSLRRFLHFLRQICLGLQCAHQGIYFQGELCPIIHRDIKPSNVLIVQDPTLGELVKILDFGIAKLVQADHAQTHSFQGTLAYCSPEQMEGKPLDHRSDIYNLGVMMYEMLTGEMPVLPENNSFGSWYKAHRYFAPQPFDPDLEIPDRLQDLIFQCLAKDPASRPQSVGEILKAITPLEQLSGKRRSKKIQPCPVRSSDKLTESPTSSTLSPLVVIDEDNYRQATWPDDKPLEKIVFPRLIASSQGNLPSLWVMLEKQDIDNRIASKRYNQFLFLLQPHPMVLWITALHNRNLGTRWLPCYLDLKTDSGQQLALSLSKVGQYSILLFALEHPQTCRAVMMVTLVSAQRQQLSDWVNTSQAWYSFANPQLSKQILKRELETLKPKIQAKLEAVRTSERSNISG